MSPVTSRFPSTTRSLATVAIPEIVTLPLENIVAAEPIIILEPVPTTIPPLAVTIPAAAILPFAEAVTPEPTDILPLTVSSPVTASVDPSNVKLPLSSSSPEVPAITTLLSVRSETFAVASVAVSAFKVSISAVPSMNKSPHSLVAAPIFLVPSTSGIKLLPTDVKVDTPLMFNLLLVVTPLTLTPCGVVWKTFPLS